MNDAAENGGLRTRTPAAIDEFAETYLRGLGYLSYIRAHPAWRRYAPVCQQVVVQANLLLYPENHATGSGLWRAVWVDFPADLWRSRWYHLASLGIVLVTMLIGYCIVVQNFEMAAVFMPGMLRSTKELDAYLVSPDAQHAMLTYGRKADVMLKSQFAYMLLINNASVAVRCFVFGLGFGIPTVLVLIQTGLMMGALPALFRFGDTTGIWAWLLPHGVPEIGAIILSGGAGLRLGLSMLNPGDRSIGASIRHTLHQLSGIVILCTLLLVWAALVESFIRQSYLTNDQRFMIAGISVVPFILLFVRGWFAHRRTPTETDRSFSGAI